MISPVLSKQNCINSPSLVHSEERQCDYDSLGSLSGFLYGKYKILLTPIMVETWTVWEGSENMLWENLGFGGYPKALTCYPHHYDESLPFIFSPNRNSGNIQHYWKLYW